MSKDAAMKDATKDVEVKKGEDKSKDNNTPKQPPSLRSDIKSCLELLSQAVALLEPRFTTRVLRTLSGLRKRLAKEEIAKEYAKVLEELYPKDSSRRAELLKLLPSSQTSSSDGNEMDLDSGNNNNNNNNNKVEKKGEKLLLLQDGPLLPESDVFLSLGVVVYLLDRGDLEKAHALTLSLITQVQSLSLRTLDQLQARVYFYYSRIVELLSAQGKDGGHDRGLEDIRPVLLRAHKTANLRGDEDSQATLTNLLLRNYLHYNLYEQADLLVSKSNFPEERARNPQLARYLYHTGKIRAIQLNYSDAHANLQQAIRRAPPANVAPGFWQTAHKLFVVVELLMGDIPERSIFRQPVLRRALVPYFEIVQAVRVGDVNLFNKTLDTHASRFHADTNYTLILRLRHTVIKTALRTISLAYSRIPLSDVCSKLHLESEEDAEYVVAKAIRDGVVDVEVDHEKGWMIRSGGPADVYSTSEPSRAFDERIRFCLKLHNDSVKAMRYPLNAHRKELESVEEAQERQRELQAEVLDQDADPDFGPDGDLF